MKLKNCRESCQTVVVKWINSGVNHVFLLRSQLLLETIILWKLTNKRFPNFLGKSINQLKRQPAFLKEKGNFSYQEHYYHILFIWAKHQSSNSKAMSSTGGTGTQRTWHWQRFELLLISIVELFLVKKLLVPFKYQTIQQQKKNGRT